MILILDNNGYIQAYNSIRLKESVDPSKNEVWHEGEFNFYMGEDIEGKTKRFKYVNGNIEIIHFDVPEFIEPSESEPTPDLVMEKLNAMEEKLNALTSDSVTVANVETAILEGVNEV